MSFKEKVIEVVKKITEGSFLSYKEVARIAGDEKAYRVIGNILAKNKDLKIPCHRVIRNNGLVGKYSFLNFLRNSENRKESEFYKAGILLKEGAIGIIPTDTIYGICTSALKKDSVEKVYSLRKRNLKKPMIILISSLEDLKIFKIRLSKKQKEIIRKIWPAKISIIFPCPYREFEYLHRGTKGLAFRLPKSKWLLEILKISGPLVAPSANFEGETPAKTIKEAKKYFGNKVFYLDKGKLEGKSSTLIRFINDKIEILRKGSEYKKILNLFKVIKREQQSKN